MAIESLSYLSPESTLLLLCSSTELNSRDFDSIRVMVEKGVDWDLLLQHALYHKSFPLFYNALKGVCPDMVPEAVLQQLKGHYMKNAVHSLFLAGTLIKVLQLLKQNDIFAVPFKRPVLSETIFGETALRSYGDLDINNYFAAMIVIRGRVELDSVPQYLIEDGSRIFDGLWHKWGITHPNKN